MQRYRKKPVEVDGLLYTGDNDDELAAFVGTSHMHPVRSENDPPGSNWLPAHHGQTAKVWNTSQFSWNDVNPGDTVLRGLVGECYPCSPDALAATYEATRQPAGPVVHFAGPDIQVDALLRQRCAWCGTVLVDYDLRRVAVPAGQDPRPATWPVGTLVQVDGPVSHIVEAVPGKLPDYACALADLYPGDQLAAEVTV